MQIEEQQKKYMPLTGGFGFFFPIPEAWSRALEPFWRFMALPAQVLILAWAVVSVTFVYRTGMSPDMDSGWVGALLLANLVRRPSRLGDIIFLMSLCVALPGVLVTELLVKPDDTTLWQFVLHHLFLVCCVAGMAVLFLIALVTHLRKPPATEMNA